MRKILYILSLIPTVIGAEAFADGEVVSTEGINFGKFVQLAYPSIVTVPSDGSAPTYGVGYGTASAVNGSSANSAKINTINYSETLNLDTTKDDDGDPKTANSIVFNQGHTQSTVFCSATISDLTFSPKEIPANSNSTVSVGATLKINGYCQEGIYKGDMEVTYQFIVGDNKDSTNKLVHVPFQFEIEEPLSVAKKDNIGDMDFGMYISPSVDSTVTVSSSGVSTTGDIARVGARTPHGANLVVTGVGNRYVQMTFDAPTMKLYLNGDAKANPNGLDVTNFTVNNVDVSDGTHTFQLPDTPSAQCSKDLVVGATLKINGCNSSGQCTAPGQYTGSIGVTFIYNDSYRNK